MSDARVAVHALSRAAGAIRQISEGCEREYARPTPGSGRRVNGVQPNLTLTRDAESAGHMRRDGEIQREIAEILRIEADFGRLVGRILDLVERVREGAVLESRREMADYMEACARQLRAHSG